MSSNNLKKAAYKKYLAAVVAGTVTLSGCGNSNTPANNDEVVTDKETDEKTEEEENVQNVHIYSAPAQQKFYNPNNVETYAYGSTFSVCTEQSLEELSKMGINMGEKIKLNDHLNVLFIETRHDSPQAIKYYQEMYGDINVSDDLANQNLTQFAMVIVSTEEPINDKNLYEMVIQPICKDQLKGNIYMIGEGVDILSKEDFNQIVSANYEKGKQLRITL